MKEQVGRLSLRDRFQVSAFQTEYRLLGKGEGKDSMLNNPILRFVTAICRTSDDRTEAILERDPNLIDRWAALLEK